MQRVPISKLGQSRRADFFSFGKKEKRLKGGKELDSLLDGGGWLRPGGF